MSAVGNLEASVKVQPNISRGSETPRLLVWVWSHIKPCAQRAAITSSVCVPEAEASSDLDICCRVATTVILVILPNFSNFKLVNKCNLSFLHLFSRISFSNQRFSFSFCRHFFYYMVANVFLIVKPG